MNEFTVHVDAAPGSGVDVDVLGRAHDVAQEMPALLSPAIAAHGDEHDAAIGATFQVSAPRPELAATIAAAAFLEVLERAGVPAELVRIDHLEIDRERQAAVA